MAPTTAPRSSRRCTTTRTGSTRAWPGWRTWRCLRRVPQTLRLGQHLELLERVVLDLADALARDPERAADLLERARLLAGQPEAHLDDLALALRQRIQCFAHVLPAHGLERGLERRLGRVVLDEVAQLG